MRAAVVDIGTNSTRLLIADIGRDGELTEVVRRSLVTRLGDGLDAGGRLAPDARERVLGVLADYAEAIAGAGAEKSLAVMTSAVRDAADGRDFAAAVRERTGLEGRILSGDEEAGLTFAGATATRSAEGLVVVDVGGGSTELVADGFHVSLQVGVVRHAERHLHDDPPTPSQLAALAADVRAALAAAGVPPALPVREMVAVAGTATSCAAIDLALEVYDTARIEGHVLRRPTLEALRDRLAALPLAGRRAVTGLHPDRAPVILPGIVILLEILAEFGLDAVVASDRDILHGVARALAGARIPRTGEPNLMLSGRLYDGAPVSPAGYSIASEGRSCLPPPSPDA